MTRIPFEHPPGHPSTGQHLKQNAFLVDMSHEIRTPLGVIIGFTELLRHGNVMEKDKKHYLDVIVRNGRHLENLINDLLDLAKVDSGKLNIEQVPTHLPELASDIIRNFQIKAAEKKISLKLEILPNVPEWITTDPTRLKQIITNLICNAIKFTDHGGVRLTLGARHQTGGAISLIVDVHDTGIGIPEHLQCKLFKPFGQTETSINRRYGGTGLGLSLSKKLAQAMHGSLNLESSSPGEGSTFRLEIPAVAALLKLAPTSAPVALSPVLAEQLRRLKILIVDDSPDNQELFSLILSRRGVCCAIANNGLEAFEMASRQHFDLILMDISMPVMDGYAAAQKLRDAGYAKPIIALSAHALKGTKEKCLLSGYSDHLSKPVHSEILIQKILEHVEHDQHPDEGLTHSLSS